MADQEGVFEDPEVDPCEDEGIERFEEGAFVNPGGWIAAEQAAERARVGLPLIRQALRNRQLRHVRVGRKNGPIRTCAAWVDAWMMRWVVEPTAD